MRGPGGWQQCVAQSNGLPLEFAEGGFLES